MSAYSYPIEAAGIMELLPHRPPFLLLDRILDCRPHERVVAVKNVSVGETHFQGHFPGNPVMPGVLIVEAMGQTGAVLMSKSLDVDPAGKTIFFMSIDNCRFRAPVRPGDVLRMEVGVTYHRRGVFKFHGKASVNSKMAAEADFAAMLVETADG